MDDIEISGGTQPWFSYIHLVHGLHQGDVSQGQASRGRPGASRALCCLTRAGCSGQGGKWCYSWVAIFIGTMVIMDYHLMIMVYLAENHVFFFFSGETGDSA